MPLRIGVSGLVLAVLGGGMALAGPLDDARSAVDGSDYMAARASLDKALHAGGASPEDVAEIYKLTGIVEGALGNAEIASNAFARWLELDPKGALPPGTSPKIVRPFKTAQSSAKGIEAKAETVAKPPSVTLTVTSDSQHLIASAHVIAVVDGGVPKQIDGEPGVAIALPHGHRIDLQVQALDSLGNRVFELGSQKVPLVLTGADDGAAVASVHDKPKSDEPRHPRAWYFQWYSWGGAAIVGAAVSGVFAYETKQNLNTLDYLNRNSLDHPYSDAQAVESNAKRDVLVADIAAGAAGAFALGAVILYLTRPELEHLPVAAVPTRDGAALVLGGHF
jgi:hypothetical protein